MRVQLYLDEDSARHSLARELRVRGAEVATALEVGMVGRSDDDQLEWAAKIRFIGRYWIFSFERGLTTAATGRSRRRAVGADLDSDFGFEPKVKLRFERGLTTAATGRSRLTSAATAQTP